MLTVTVRCLPIITHFHRGINTRLPIRWRPCYSETMPSYWLVVGHYGVYTAYSRLSHSIGTARLDYVLSGKSSMSSRPIYGIAFSFLTMAETQAN